MFALDEDNLALARYYRPSMFDDTYIGNTNTKKAMLATIHASTQGRNAQIHLLTGSAGTGKTTSARIMAKYYRCENLTPDGHACNECYSCENFNEYILTGSDGALSDFRELDSTSVGNKETIDQLIEEAEYPCTEKYRVYIFDECHAITGAAQSRLLKFLEEPPENILIFLCTTNPEKMLDTIISRCRVKFEIVKPKLNELIQLLEYVCEDKGFIYEPKALRLLATKADLAQRKALNELEAVSIENNLNITYDYVVEKFNTIADSYFRQFYELLLDEAIRLDKYIELIGLVKESFGIKQFISDLIPFTIRGIYVINGVQQVGLDESEKLLYKKLFAHLNVVEVASLLKHLVDISRSKEAELLLLQLGFIGFRNERALKTRNAIEGTPQNEQTKLLQHDLLGVGAESNIGLTNFIEKQKESTKNTEEFVKEHLTDIDSADALAKMFSLDVVE